jgi:hypothetical protein
VPLQSVTKTGKPIFAYMRRSTTKKEQASSLPQQEEWIELIAKTLWIDYSDIIPYTESRSGYENRTRKEWDRMLSDIDKAKDSCTILCRDTSRLSRNPTDNLAIANRIFGDNRYKKSIWNIYYLGENFAVSEWNEKTNKKHIVDTLHQNYTDSMENKEKCIAWVLLKLNMWEFPYAPPHGLSRVNSEWLKRTSRSEKTTLKQNDKLQFVRRAFQMKAEWKPAKEICKYLKQYGNISISTKSIVETLIANTVYKWEYTEKTTGTFFDSIRFYEWKPPIEKDLWERANAKVGKRGHGFWLGQEDHIAKWKLKYENWKSLYMYKAKGKYNAYQTEIKTEDGKRKSISIMESKIVKEFLSEVIPKITELYYAINESSIDNAIKEAENIFYTSISEQEYFKEVLQDKIDFWKLKYSLKYKWKKKMLNLWKKSELERQRKQNILERFTAEEGMEYAKLFFKIKNKQNLLKEYLEKNRQPSVDIDKDYFINTNSTFYKKHKLEEIELCNKYIWKYSDLYTKEELLEVKHESFITEKADIYSRFMLESSITQSPTLNKDSLEKEIKETKRNNLNQKNKRGRIEWNKNELTLQNYLLEGLLAKRLMLRR